jgi:hypothetical protein
VREELVEDRPGRVGSVELGVMDVEVVELRKADLRIGGGRWPFRKGEMKGSDGVEREAREEFG